MTLPPHNHLIQASTRSSIADLRPAFAVCLLAWTTHPNGFLHAAGSMGLTRSAHYQSASSLSSPRATAASARRVRPRARAPPMALSVCSSNMPYLEDLSSFTSDASWVRKHEQLKADTTTASFHRLDAHNLENLDHDRRPLGIDISFWYPRGQAAPNGQQSGSLQPGPFINFFAFRNIGLVVNVVALGYLDGLLPMLTQKLVLSNAPDGDDDDDGITDDAVPSIAHRLVTLRCVLQLARIVVALFSDLVPIASSRRRPYLVMAWTALLGVFVAMTTASSVNDNGGSALHWAPPYLALLPVGHLLAAVTCDALVVEYAHREGLRERGCAQMLLLAGRYVGDVLGRSMLAVHVNRRRATNTEASTAVRPALVMGAALALLALSSSFQLVHIPAQGVSTSPSSATGLGSVPHRLHQLGAFLVRPVTSHVLLFGALQTMSLAWGIPTAAQLATQWLSFSASQLALSDAVNRALAMVGALAMCALGRNVSWPVLTVSLLVIGSLLATLPATLLLSMRVTASPAFFFGAHHVAALSDAALAMVRALVVVELAVPGLEATCFAVATTVFDLGTAVGSVVSHMLFTVVQDPASPRQSGEGFASIGVALLVGRLLLQLVTLRLLPRQKRETQREIMKLAVSPTQQTWARIVVVGLSLVFASVLSYLLVLVIRGHGGIRWVSSLLYT